MISRLNTAMAALLSFVCLCATGAGANEPSDAVLKAQSDRVAVLDRICQTAVAVFPPNGEGGGSGVLISADGYALSNFHVTKPCGEWMQCGLADGKLYNAVLVGFDPVGDVALIRLLGRDDFPFANMGDSDRVQAGDWAYAIGNPFVLATDFKPTVSYGIISGVHRYQYPAGTLLEYADCIQTDAAINPGNSGGPLFSASGDLIGINGRGSFEKRGRVNVGVGYAISINQIKNFLGHLHAGRIVDHATLGATVSTSGDGRVLVSDILEDCDAYRRGLRYGDELTQFSGRPIRTVNAFKNVLGTLPKDWRVPLSFRRQGKTFDVHVRLAGVHSSEELLAKALGKVEEPDRPDEKPQPKPIPLPEHPDAEPAPDSPHEERRHADDKQMPAAAKAQYTAKRGFANYYFNTLELDRVWNAFVAHGDFSSLSGEWVLKGDNGGGGPATYRLSDDESGFELPGGQMSLPLDGSLLAMDHPAGSGGLLPALHLWRKLLVHGPDRLGDVHYEGTMPLVGQERLVDALEANVQGVQCRFLFSPDSGLLLAMEYYFQSNTDPCELYFSDYRESEGRQFPMELVVRRGDEVYAVYRWSETRLDGEAP